MLTERILKERQAMRIEPNLEWHERLIQRMLGNNPEATIKDYAKVTGGFSGVIVKDGERTMEIRNFKPFEHLV